MSPRTTILVSRSAQLLIRLLRGKRFDGPTKLDRQRIDAIASIDVPFGPETPDGRMRAVDDFNMPREEYLEFIERRDPVRGRRDGHDLVPVVTKESDDKEFPAFFKPGFEPDEIFSPAWWRWWWKQ